MENQLDVRTQKIQDASQTDFAPMIHMYNFSPLHLLLWCSLCLLPLCLCLFFSLRSSRSFVSPLDPLHSPSFLFDSLCHLSFMYLAKACREFDRHPLWCFSFSSFLCSRSKQWRRGLFSLACACIINRCWHRFDCLTCLVCRGSTDLRFNV